MRQGRGGAKFGVAYLPSTHPIGPHTSPSVKHYSASPFPSFTGNCVWIVEEQSCYCSHLFPHHQPPHLAAAEITQNLAIYQTAWINKKLATSAHTLNILYKLLETHLVVPKFRVMSFIRTPDNKLNDGDILSGEGLDCSDFFPGHLQFVSASSCLRHQLDPPNCPYLSCICAFVFVFDTDWPHDLSTLDPPNCPYLPWQILRPQIGGISKFLA